MTPEQYLQKLIALSSEKLDRLKEMLELTKRQSGFITEDSVDELQEIIDLKQRQMNLIDELDDAFEVYFSRLKSVLGVQSIEEISMGQYQGAAELKQLIKIIFDTMAQIQVIEKDNNEKARGVLSKLSGQIRQVKQGRIANNGYNIGGKLPQQSYFFDTKK
jgi:FlgN protein.